MIRLLHFLRRAPGLSAEDFTTKWRDIHGPLTASFQTDLNIMRHVQVHSDPFAQGLEKAAGDARGGIEPPFDGVAEYWWTSPSALQEALATDAGKAAHARLLDSEATFCDLSASPLWFAVEFPQVATSLRRPVAHIKSGVMRLLFAFHGLSHLSDEETCRYWREDHGPLVRSHSAARGLMAYNQVHRIESTLAEELSSARQCTIAPYLGHAEAWFDRLSANSGPEADAATAAAVADERNFIDWKRSTFFIGKELVFIEREWA
ncbi:MAG: EthD domain-containing protein [Caenibius sp.]